MPGHLQDATRSTDTVAHLGGDGFGVLAQGLRSAADAEQLATKVLGLVESIRVPSFAHPQVGVTIGASLLPDASIPSVACAIQVADELRCKRSEKGTIRVALHGREREWLTTDL